MLLPNLELPPQGNLLIYIWNCKGWEVLIRKERERASVQRCQIKHNIRVAIKALKFLKVRWGQEGAVGGGGGWHLQGMGSPTSEPINLTLFNKHFLLFFDLEIQWNEEIERSKKIPEKVQDFLLLPPESFRGHMSGSPSSPLCPLFQKSSTNQSCYFPQNLLNYSCESRYFHSCTYAWGCSWWLCKEGCTPGLNSE